MKSVLLSSPAKLNLFLDVLRKRPDGYHDILTLFERIALADSIRLIEIRNDEIVLSATSGNIPLDHRNLAYQAADLLKRTRGVSRGVKIEIIKNIPVGAGLAGGSSNAASVLLGLNRLFDLKLSRKTLISYANRLGSDVAFFVSGKRFALGRGRGGELEALDVPQKVILWHLLFIPPVRILSKDVYRLLDKETKKPKNGPRERKILRLTRKPYNVNMLTSYLRRNDIFSLNRNIYNRLSETVIKSYSFVSELKSDLLKFGLKHVHMSGSGPALFANFNDEDRAQRVLRAAEDRFSDRCRIILTSTQ